MLFLFRLSYEAGDILEKMFMSVLPDVCATEVKSCSSCFDLAAAARGEHFSCRVVVFRVHRPWLLSTTGSALSRWSEKLNTNIRLTNNERQQYQSDWSVLPPASILCFWDHQKKPFHLIQHMGKSYILHASMKKWSEKCPRIFLQREEWILPCQGIGGR